MQTKIGFRALRGKKLDNMTFQNSKFIKKICSYYRPLMWASVVLYIISFYFPVYVDANDNCRPDTHHIQGIFMLLFGIFTIESSSFFSYVCNGVYICILVSFFVCKPYHFSYFKMLLALYAPLAALWFPFSTVPMDEAVNYGAVKEVFSGYYLWTASMFLMSLSAIARMLKTKFD